MKVLNYHLILIGLAWASVQIFCYLHFGVISSVDTSFYLEEAARLIQEYLPDGRGTMYLSYSLVLALIQLLSLPIESVVIFQLVASAAALYSTYYLARKLHNSRGSGFTAALLYIFWVKIHQWNFILYTDSLFCSLVIVTFTLIYLAQNKWQPMLAIGLLVFTIFLRPNGAGFLIGLIGYILAHCALFNKLKSSQKIGIVFFGVLVILFFINRMLEPYVSSFIESYSRAEIIYPNQQLFIAPEQELITPDSEWPALVQITYFGVANPFYFVKLFLLKSILFLAHIKPYFSWAHNLLIVLFLYPIYWFAFRGVKQLEDFGLSVFVLSFIGLQTAIVGLTSENWDGRFLIPMLPFVFVLAAGGIHKNLKKIARASYQ